MFESFFNSLTLIDIGFGTMFIYNVYKPLAEDNESDLRYQVAIFKKIYHTIANIILFVSLLFIPFIYVIFNIDYPNKFVVYSIYIIQLLAIYFKYIFLHKAKLIKANQKEYISNLFVIILDLVTFILKIISVIIYKSFILYIFFVSMYSLVLTLFECIVINKEYPSLKKTPKVYYSDIKKSGVLSQCKNYLFRTFYDLVYYSMDNFIISTIFVTSVIGYIANYSMILSTVSYVIVMIMVSLRSMMANFFYSEKNHYGYFQLYKVVNLFCSLITSFAVAGIYTMIDDFMALWLGSKYIISRPIVDTLIITMLIDSCFRGIENVFAIEGYMFKEKIPLLISALCNFVFSLLFLKKWGLVGVYLGTLLGKLVFWAGKLFYVINGIFKNERKELMIQLIGLILFLVISPIFVSSLANMVIPVVSNLSAFILKCLLCCLLNFVLIIILFFRNRTFKNLINSIKNTIVPKK